MSTTGLTAGVALNEDASCPLCPANAFPRID